MALRIGELAKRAGVAASALRYYEAEGLLGASARSKAGYRLYEPEAVGRVEFIQRAKSLGLPLSQIRRSSRALMPMPALSERRCATRSGTN